MRTIPVDVAQPGRATAIVPPEKKIDPETGEERKARECNPVWTVGVAVRRRGRRASAIEVSAVTLVDAEACSWPMGDPAAPVPAARPEGGEGPARRLPPEMEELREGTRLLADRADESGCAHRSATVTGGVVRVTLTMPFGVLLGIVIFLLLRSGELTAWQVALAAPLGFHLDRTTLAEPLGTACPPSRTDSTGPTDPEEDRPCSAA